MNSMTGVTGFRHPRYHVLIPNVSPSYLAWNKQHSTDMQIHPLPDIRR